MTDRAGKIVSSEEEPLILVDADDRETGTLSKASCHDGDGILHRAFSVFLFDRDGRLLLQQRAAGKRLWPMFWSNSCCSHPRRGEQIAEAAARRLEDELHTTSELEFVYKFIYQAKFGGLGSEHELCHVFLGRVQGEPAVNETEIAATRYVTAPELAAEMASEPAKFTPWLKLEWQRLCEDYPEVIARFTGVLPRRK